MLYIKFGLLFFFLSIPPVHGKTLISLNEALARSRQNSFELLEAHYQAKMAESAVESVDAVYDTTVFFIDESYNR